MGRRGPVLLLSDKPPTYRTCTGPHFTGEYKMGEYADYMINGDDCQQCGQTFLKSYGHPTTCTDCGGNGKLASDASEKEMKKAGWK